MKKTTHNIVSSKDVKFYKSSLSSTSKRTHPSSGTVSTPQLHAPVALLQRKDAESTLGDDLGLNIGVVLSKTLSEKLYKCSCKHEVRCGIRRREYNSTYFEGRNKTTKNIDRTSPYCGCS